MALHTYVYVKLQELLTQKLFSLVLLLVDTKNMYFGTA